MKVLTTRGELARWRRGRPPCTLAPTMGALHAGHASLIADAAARARARGAPCLVTLFVNPTQFNDPADFERYPRPLEADLRLCAAAGADAVFAPGAAEVYPPDEEVPTPPLPPAATEPGLEDAARPGHFAGVCRVVLRLLRLTGPAAAVFGEKDWQQLQVIRQMTAALGLGVEIAAHPTVREPDGLAMSSRNVFLTPEQRRRAGCLVRALRAGAVAADAPRAEAAMRHELEAGGAAVDYAVVREASTLRPARGGPGPWRALVAARLGAVRLIDNAPWPA